MKRSRRARVSHVCKQCGKTFLWLDRPRAFCNKKCYGEWRSVNIAGSQVHNWKGGITEDKNAYARAVRKALRMQFIEAYGGKCICCGITEWQFLTVEHINRDGKAHRQIYRSSAQVLADLRRRGWPKEGYELLCFNCNRARWEHGVCPHVEEKERE